MQGCAEIRWLAEKMGAKPATVAGLSGLGDIMLTCYGSLSRNRCTDLAAQQQHLAFNLSNTLFHLLIMLMTADSCILVPSGNF